MRKRLKSQAGVTFMELMITAVIIGIVAAAAVPKFQTAYERIQFKSANRDLASSLKLARSMAITDKSQYGVHFDDQAMVVTLFKDVTTGSYSYSSGSDSIIRVDSMPYTFHYMSVDCDGNVIFFRPNGSADFSGGGNIWTLADGEGILAIYGNNVLASTGRVHTEAYYY